MSRKELEQWEYELIHSKWVDEQLITVRLLLSELDTKEHKASLHPTIGKHTYFGHSNRGGIYIIA